MIQRVANLIRALSGFVVEEHALEELAHALRAEGVAPPAIADALVEGMERPLVFPRRSVFGGGAPLGAMTVLAGASASLALRALGTPLAWMPLVVAPLAILGAVGHAAVIGERGEEALRAIQVAGALRRAGISAELAARTARFVAPEVAGEIDERLNLDRGNGPEPALGLALAAAELSRPSPAARRRAVGAGLQVFAAVWVAITFWGLYFASLKATLGDALP